ncbi:MAG: response regulator transcription factor, partial [Clostridia bacterium]|nr:response regulator transcription factor [Clostridia bacterium]
KGLENDYLQMSGFECDIATDGETGLNMAKSENYALIIVDIMLPGRDGFSVCKEIRKEKDIPIIFLSAKSDDIDKVRGLGLGADDYMTKPFSPSELVARVKSHIQRYEKLISRGAEKKKDIIVIRGLKIDKNAHRVYIDEEEVAMPVKEFELLLFLAENPNIVFSKERLFDRIWGMDAMGDVSTVTVHIQRIRDKIDRNQSGNKYIETVWGAGYRFRI